MILIPAYSPNLRRSLSQLRAGFDGTFENSIIRRVFLDDIYRLSWNDVMGEVCKSCLQGVDAIGIPIEFFAKDTNHLVANGIGYVNSDCTGPRHCEETGAESPGIQATDVNAGIEGNA